MPRIETTTKTIYQFNELSEDQKKKAHEKAVSSENWLEWEWWDSVYEDFGQICALMGIDPNTYRNGKKTNAIQFSGFSCQGDGASFAGDYTYRKGMVKAIEKYAPQDEELLGIAKELQKIQRRNFYQVTCDIRTSGHYCHEYSMLLDNVALRGDVYAKDFTEDEKELLECFRSLARWLYKQLEKEYDYHNSFEAFAESALANEWEFDESGKMV